MARDPAQAARWLERAMVGGSLEAKLDLASNCLWDGVRNDPQLSPSWFQQASNHGTGVWQPLSATCIFSESSCASTMGPHAAGTRCADNWNLFLEVDGAQAEEIDALAGRCFDQHKVSFQYVVRTPPGETGCVSYSIARLIYKTYKERVVVTQIDGVNRPPL